MVTIMNTNFLGYCQAHCIPGISWGLILSSNNYKRVQNTSLLEGESQQAPVAYRFCSSRSR